MKSRLLPFLAGILAMLLLLELVFRVLPVATATQSGYYQHPLIVSYPARHCFESSTGWDLKNAQRNCTNNIGFLAERDFVAGEDAVGLIGDSYVEASMLPAGLRLAAILERRLKGRPVYAFGGPGSNLLDYAERAIFASEKFGITTFVFVLERGDIKQGLCGSGHVHGVCIDAATGLIRSETLADAGALKRVVRKSALAQYMVSQLKIDFSKLKPAGFGMPPAQPLNSGTGISNARQAAVVDVFFRRISNIQNAKFIFVVDADRGRLLEAGFADRNDVAEQIRQGAIGPATVIDTASSFKSYLLSTGRILDVGPYDRHWNSDAIAIVAELVGKALLAQKDK